jgi:hypothetical protein
MTSTNVNTNIFRMLGQHWTETTYVDEANYDFNTRNITNAHWSEMYRDVILDYLLKLILSNCYVPSSSN